MSFHLKCMCFYLINKFLAKNALILYAACSKIFLDNYILQCKKSMLDAKYTHQNVQRDTREDRLTFLSSLS